ncbi:MAG: hypothetical protein AB7I41_14775 [Candidatus Sericytochromatia bacterium]
MVQSVTSAVGSQVVLPPSPPPVSRATPPSAVTDVAGGEPQASSTDSPTPLPTVRAESEFGAVDERCSWNDGPVAVSASADPEAVIATNRTLPQSPCPEPVAGPRPVIPTREEVIAKAEDLERRRDLLSSEVREWVTEETARREAAARPPERRGIQPEPVSMADPSLIGPVVGERRLEASPSSERLDDAWSLSELSPMPERISADDWSLDSASSASSPALSNPFSSTANRLSGPVAASREPDYLGTVREIPVRRPGERARDLPTSFAPSPEEIAAEYDRRGGLALRYETGAYTETLQRQLAGLADERSEILRSSEGGDRTERLAQNQGELQSSMAALSTWSGFLNHASDDGRDRRLETDSMRTGRRNNEAILVNNVRMVASNTPLPLPSASPGQSESSEPGGRGTFGTSLAFDFTHTEAEGSWSQTALVSGGIGYANSDGSGAMLTLGYSNTRNSDDERASAIGARFELFNPQGSRGGIQYSTLQGFTLSEPFRIPLGEVGEARLGVEVVPYVGANDGPWRGSGVRVNLISMPFN